MKGTEKQVQYANDIKETQSKVFNNTQTISRRAEDFSSALISVFGNCPTKQVEDKDFAENLDVEVYKTLKAEAKEKEAKLLEVAQERLTTIDDAVFFIENQGVFKALVKTLTSEEVL